MRYLMFMFAAALMFTVPMGLQAKGEKSSAALKEVVSTEYNTLSAKVTGVNQSTHTLSLQNDLGESLKVQVDPKLVKNFSQIKKGDNVVVRQQQSLALSLTKHQKGQKPMADSATVTGTAPVGAKPGVEQAKVVQISAKIVKIDQAKHSVKLKGPEGNVVLVKVKDPNRLKGLKKGDMVAATYTKTLAVSVESAPKK